MKKRELNRDLCLALDQGNFEAAKKLIAQGADVNTVRSGGETFTLLWLAANMAGQETSKNWKDLAAGLAEVLPNVPQRNHAAKREQWLQILKLLIEAKADVNKLSQGSTPLRIAVHRGDLEVVKLLLANGANPNAETFSVLSKLAKKEGKKLVPSYLDTVLHEAVAKNSPAVVRALLDAGAEITRMDHEGKTPLALAKMHGHKKVAGILVEAGAMK